jgi:ribosomal protein S18 acetylase RimI-like enzyme
MKIIEINTFTTRVFNAVLQLLPQLNPDVALPTEQHFKGILESGRTHLFIAETEDKKITGMLTIATYDIPTGTKVWIEDVVVDESQRGRGYGEELMLFAIGFARSIGAEAIELTSRPSRIAANKLYQKLGFVIRETNLYKFYLGFTSSPGY